MIKPQCSTDLDSVEWAVGLGENADEVVCFGQHRPCWVWERTNSPPPQHRTPHLRGGTCSQPPTCCPACLRSPLRKLVDRVDKFIRPWDRVPNLPVEPADHAIGRSRGSLSTKIHTLTDDRTRPVAVILTPGQSGDNPQLEPLLDLHRQQYPLPRRPRFRLLADKAYSHPSTREKLRGRRIPHTIPER